MKYYTIKSAHLKDWLQRIIEATPRVLAPVKDGKKIYFRPVKRPEDVDESGLATTESAKEAAFPRTETLFTYSRHGKVAEVADVPAETFPGTVIWRAHPCDAAGFGPLDAIFNWDYKDIVYNNRRNKLTIVAFSCRQADEFCFCTSVGGGPGNTAGADILVTDLSDGTALLEVQTEKGERLAELYDGGLTETTDNLLEKKQAVLAGIPQRFTREDVSRHLAGAFDSPVWKQQSQRCLGCGACAFVCPTCACFDIQEKNEGTKGSRLRCWDSCGFSLFTLHTGGYNPRPTQQTRWRQRILHKFSYMPDRLQVYGCTGCGRCSRACPVEMDIAEHLTSIATCHE